MDKLRYFHRGEIYIANLDPVVGHEQGGIRPVVILQNEVGNYFCPTVIVSPATGNIEKKPSQPTHVILNDAEGLKPSVFLLEVIRTIDKSRLQKYVGKLTDKQMAEIDAAACMSLSLYPADRSNKANKDSPVNPWMIMSLCPSCRQQLSNTGCYRIRRVFHSQAVKEPCTYCQVRTGFDYYLEPRYPGKARGRQI